MWCKSLMFLYLYHNENDLHTKNKCSPVLPILEYCCQNWFCNPFQSKAIGLSDSYHNLTSSTNFKQNHWTSTASGKAWVFIQSLVLRRCASASSSGLPANSGLKGDQFNWGIGSGWIGCVGGAIGSAGVAGSCTGRQEVPLMVYQWMAEVQVVCHLTWLSML